MAGKKKTTSFKVGDCVEVVANTAGHGIMTGTVSKVCSIQSSYYRLEGYNYNVAAADLKLVLVNFTKDSVEKEKVRLTQEVQALDSKLAYLDETGQDEGSEQEFRVYQTLSLVEDKNLTKQEKAKAIAALLDGQD